MKNIFRILAIAIGVAVASTSGFCAANNSNASTVTLTATLPESLTIAATPSAVTFNLVAGQLDQQWQRAGGDHHELGSERKPYVGYADGLVLQRGAGDGGHGLDSRLHSDFGNSTGR